MVKVMAAVAPTRGSMWRVLLLSALLLSLLLSFPLTARADDDDGKRFTVTAFVLVANPGNVVPLDPKNTKFRTTGEVILGCITSSTWTAIQGSGSCSPANPDLFVDHNSMTTVKPSGQITGHAFGKFSRLGTTLSGSYSGTISAQSNPQIPFPFGIFHVEDRGNWTMSDGKGNKAKGTFRIELNPFQVPGIGGTLAGTLTMNGIHRMDD